MKCEMCGRRVEHTEDFVVAGLGADGVVIKKASMAKKVCPECLESLKGQLDTIVQTLTIKASK
jgi:hypothetical protein